jgi:hypothetical protein
MRCRANRDFILIVLSDRDAIILPENQKMTDYFSAIERKYTGKYYYETKPVGCFYDIAPSEYSAGFLDL